MKKAKALGYQALPGRSTSPFDRVLDRGQNERSHPGPAVVGRRATLPAGNEVPSSRRLPRAGKAIAPGQPPAPGRTRERFISLPDELQGEVPVPEASEVPTIFEDLPQQDGAGMRGRITVYCIAESVDRKALELRLKEVGGNALLHQYPDVLYGQLQDIGGPRGDIFYFDYGVLAFWGLTEVEEREIIRTVVAPALIDPLPLHEIEVDEFTFQYTLTEKPHVQNDIFTINYRLASDHVIKLSISNALAQSTKLTVYEQRVMEIVEHTKDLPEILATTGEVRMSRKSIAQLIGRVFIQKSAVNLLSTVLDTPEFFWSAPDAMQNLYKRVCDYMEYDTRVEVLNSRFQVLQEMLDMLRDHQNNYHTARLEWIVIWLIVIEVVVGIFESMSILGWVGND